MPDWRGTAVVHILFMRCWYIGCTPSFQVGLSRFDSDTPLHTKYIEVFMSSGFSFDEFSRLAKPVSDYLREHGNPHDIAVITDERADILCGQLGVIFPENTEKE